MADRDRTDPEPDDPKAARRDRQRARATKGMQVSNRALKSVQLDLDAQRQRNAARGVGPLTDEEVRRLRPDRQG